jgi:hypothetical protein
MFKDASFFFYRDVNLGFTTNNQKKKGQKTMARMKA